MPISKKLPENLLLLSKSKWTYPDGAPLPLSYDCVDKMLRALPDNIQVHPNNAIHAIFEALWNYRVAEVFRKARPRSWKKTEKFWVKFKQTLEPAHNMLGTVLSKIPAPPELKSEKHPEWCSQELFDFEWLAIPSRTFGKDESAPILPPSWSIERKFTETRETLLWMMRVASALEKFALEKTERKEVKSELVYYLRLAWRDITGRNEIDPPYYNDSLEKSVSPYLDFAAPAVMELDGIEFESVATRIRRMLGIEAATSAFPKPPRRRGRKKKSAMYGNLFGLTSNTFIPTASPAYGGLFRLGMKFGSDENQDSRSPPSPSPTRK